MAKDQISLSCVLTSQTWKSRKCEDELLSAAATISVEISTSHHIERENVEPTRIGDSSKGSLFDDSLQALIQLQGLSPVTLPQAEHYDKYKGFKIKLI